MYAKMLADIRFHDFLLARAGQALRGTSEFHAWGDSNLYLRRDADTLTLSVEHRAAPSPPPITIELAQRGLALALEVADRCEPVTPRSTRTSAQRA